jgi:hypothetical protein
MYTGSQQEMASSREGSVSITTLEYQWMLFFTALEYLAENLAALLPQTLCTHFSANTYLHRFSHSLNC